MAQKDSLTAASRGRGPTLAFSQTRSRSTMANMAMGTRKSWAAVKTMLSKAVSRGVSRMAQASTASEPLASFKGLTRILDSRTLNLLATGPGDWIAQAL